MTSDVVIVGAGIIGCAVAFEAARRGLSVVVLERGDPGSGASGAAGGFISIASKRPGPHLELAQASAVLYQTLEAELEAPPGSLGMRRQGGLILAEAESDLPLLDRFIAERTGSGLRIERMGPEDLRRAEPHLSHMLPGALLCPDDSEAFPLRVLDAYRNAAIRLGAVIRRGSPIVGTCRIGGEWRIETPAESWDAPQVVIAVGAWSREVGRMFGVALPVRPRRGQALLIPDSVARPHRPILSAGYFRSKYTVADDHSAPSVELSLWRRPDGLLFAGGTREWAGFDLQPIPEMLFEIRRRADAAMPGLREAPEGTPHLGFRPYSETGLPILGPIPGAPGVFAATGHEGDGICLAPITGSLLGQTLSGERADLDLEPFRPPSNAE